MNYILCKQVWKFSKEMNIKSLLGLFKVIRYFRNFLIKKVSRNVCCWNLNEIKNVLSYIKGTTFSLKFFGEKPTICFWSILSPKTLLTGRSDIHCHRDRETMISEKKKSPIYWVNKIHSIKCQINSV